MSVTLEDVAQVAELARLCIDDNELRQVTERFSRILDMVDELQTVSTDGVEPMSNPHDHVQRLRTDEVTETNQREQLMSNAPVAQDGYFLVPKVID